MTSQAPTSRGPTDAGLTARVLSIHRPISFAPRVAMSGSLTNAAETFSPVTGGQWRFHDEPETLSAAFHLDRSEPKPLLLSSQGSPVNPLTGAGFDKVRSFPIQFASRRLLPRWQIGSPLTPCRIYHRLRGFRPHLTIVAVRGFQHLPNAESDVNKTHFLSLSGLSQEQIGTKEKQTCCVNSTIRMRTRTK